MLAVSLSDWTSIAQLVIAVAAASGVIYSVYLSTKALREVQFDRRQRQKPHLAFERGGYLYKIKFVKAGPKIPGINPKAVEELLPDLPKEAESVRLLWNEKEDKSKLPTFIGKLRNFGLGPALSVSVRWKAVNIKVGQETFRIDETKLSEPLYGSDLNTMPCVPAHIQAGGEAGIPRLPTFIEKDFDKKISEVEGVLLISAYDVFNQRHKFEQEDRVFTDYQAAEPSIIVTFGETISA